MPPPFPSAATRTELLARLDHFALQPRVVLDLGGGVTQGEATALRRRFPAARLLLTGGPAPATAATGPLHRVRRVFGALRGRLPGLSPAMEHLDAPLDRLPLADGSVDLALGQWLAPGVAALDAVLVELRRVLAPGGLFLWTTPGAGAAPDGHIDLHDLGSALARAGFLEPVLDVDRYGRGGDAPTIEVIHAAAFAGEARSAVRADIRGGGETVVPLEALRRPGAPRP